MDTGSSKSESDTPKPKSKISLPGVIILVLLVPVTVWIWSKDYEAILLSFSELFGLNRGNERQTLLAQRDTATVETLTPAFNDLLKRLAPSLHDLEDDVDRVEKERCVEDPHLEKALRDFRNTPLAGPNPILSSDISQKNLRVLQVLIDDYVANAKDTADRVAELQPLLKSALSAFWASGDRIASERIIAFADEKADPILWYCVMLGKQVDAEYVDAARMAFSATKKRKTHPLLSALIATKLIRYKTEVSDEERGPFVEESIQSMVDTFQHHQSDEDLVKFAFGHLVGLFSNIGAAAQVELATELGRRKNPAVPEWVVHYGVSRVCSSVSATYRGEDFISQVAPDDLKRFEEFAELEAQHLKKAWTVVPDLPGIPSALLVIETRAGGTGRSSDAWFRHVVSAQLDDGYAIDAYTMDCEPRWGGSNEKLMWLANKLAECVELDSDIGYRFWHPIRRYSEDYSHTVSLARPDALSATLKIVDFLKSRKDIQPVKNVSDYRAALIAKTLWDAGLLEDLRWFLKTYGSTMNAEHTQYFRFDAKFAGIVCRAAEGEGFACWQTIVRELIHGSSEIDESKLVPLKLAIDEASMLAKDEVSREALEVATQLFRWVEHFYLGKTVELDFTDKASGWFIDPSFRVIDRNTIEFDVAPSENKCLLAPWIRFAQSYSAEAEIVVVEHEGVPFLDPWGVALQAGPAECIDINLRSKELRFSPGCGKYDWDDIPRNLGRPPECQSFKIENVRAQQKLRIEYSPTLIKGFVNDKEIASESGSFENNGIFQIGRKTAYYFGTPPPKEPKSTYRISNIRIRKLDLEPNSSNGSGK